MSVFLSEEWLEEFRKSISDLPKQKGVGGKVKFVITSSPLGKVQFCLDVSEGQVTKLVAGPDKENDVTATFKYPDAKSWFKGELDTDLAYMNGQCKFEDDYTCFMYRLRPLFSSEAWSHNLEILLASTQFE
ncbi:MAG: Uncharacterised protein [Acidimicrobiales bacterium AG-410-I20]|nr:MAG: Uncharacterised protein [Acidimicrobiales bacterium AG-410-I20]